MFMRRPSEGHPAKFRRGRDEVTDLYRPCFDLALFERPLPLFSQAVKGADR